ncbi:leucine-rich repeat domain-containing protein [Skeletonema marinoi]|uniref:Leucine-rich repeat domain-containing protein n=1 Tax=Skeletonema marinoi TaxID=267567 RepID=A0AAD8Y245_9STRA|nr:leucine-rich repeat domain-containing protein [Skeletonema marinoi]KAK1737796.1 leucine-rich repeat domain-containing protein [Skeletonema marinoi]
MAAEGDNITWYNYTGAEVIPHDATHVTVSARVIPAEAFSRNRNIVEIIGPSVEKIEARAFNKCPSLRRVIMSGVEIVEQCAFTECVALTDVECDKLEIIRYAAFNGCTSLGSINLPSVRIVEGDTFNDCEALTDVNFGSKLERIEEMAFDDCPSLERITIPLKDGIITHDGIFQGCENLKHVDIVEEVVLHETIAALQLEEWRNDINEEIDSINQILPTTPAGRWGHDVGDKARAIRTWIRLVLGKIVRYKAQHQHLLDEAATTLQLALPKDIVMKNVLPFLELQ